MTWTEGRRKDGPRGKWEAKLMRKSDSTINVPILPQLGKRSYCIVVQALQLDMKGVEVSRPWPGT